MLLNDTEKFVSNLQELMHIEPSEDDCKQVVRCLLDYLGASLAGIKLLEAKTSEIVKLMGSSGKVRPIGLRCKVSLETAALLNGLHAHVAEMDDGVRFGMIHPGAPIFSALLPLAQTFKVKKINFIKGVLVGYDAAVRLASAVQPTHYQRGYHPSATCGSIGATMGLAAMLGFNHIEMENSLGAVSVSASGSLKVVDDSSELKPLNVGRAAALAVQSAVMGKSGFTSPRDVLSGKTGFLNMTTDELSLSSLQEKHSQKLWIHCVYVKPYAACRHAHPSIQSALDLIQDYSFDVQNIKKINIVTYHGLNGRHDNQEVSCVASARMSIPFSVAIALNAGHAGINAFNQNAVEDPRNINLAKKVFVYADKKYTELVPNQRSAFLEINFNDGTSFGREVKYPKGEPENPMSDDELEHKFNQLAAFGGLSCTASDN